MCKYIPTQGKNKKTVREVYETSYAFKNMVDQEPELKRICQKGSHRPAV